MLFVRLALEEEQEAIVEMARMNAEETLPDEPFDPNRVREIFQQYLATANPTVFVVENGRDRSVIGFLSATMNLYDHRGGFFVAQKVLFVRPVNRGSRAAAILMRHLLRWADEIGAEEVFGGNDNSFRSERTAGFLEHFGFERVGFALTKRLRGYGDGRG